MEVTQQGDRGSGREIEALLVELQKGLRAVAFYPSSHPSLLKIIQQTFAPIRQAAHASGEFVFSVTRAGVWYNETLQNPENELLQGLAKFLFQRRIKKLYFLDGLTQEEWLRFLRLVSMEAEDIYLRGGLEKLLQEARLTHVFVNDIDLEYLKRGGEPAPPDVPELPEPEPPPPDPETPAAEPVIDTVGIDGAIVGDEDSIDRDNELVENQIGDLNGTADADAYYQAALKLAETAAGLLKRRRWALLFRIIQVFEQDSRNTDLDIEFRKYAIRAMRKSGSSQVIRALLTELCTDDKSESEIESLLRILELFGPATMDVVAERLKTPLNSYTETLISQLLARMGPPAIHFALGLLHGTPQPPIARLAAQTLGSLTADEGVAALEPLVFHADPTVSDAAIDGLLAIRNMDAINVLGRYLTSNAPIASRRRVLEAFGTLRETRSSVLLLDLFRKADEFELTADFRKTLNIALARIGGRPINDGLIDVLKAPKLFGPLHDKVTLSDALKILSVTAGPESLARLRSEVTLRDSTLAQQLEGVISHIEHRLSGTSPGKNEGNGS